MWQNLKILSASASECCSSPVKRFFQLALPFLRDPTMSSDCLGTINQRTRVYWLYILSGCFPCPKYGVESWLPSRTTRIKRISWILATKATLVPPNERPILMSCQRHWWTWTLDWCKPTHQLWSSVAQTSLVFNLSEFQLRWHLVQQVTWTRLHQFLGAETGSETMSGSE